MEAFAMTLTIFLARLLGLYCAIIALSMLLRRRETIAPINAMINDPGAIMIAGVIALAGGLAVILGHNVWQGGWLAVAVTCIGWVMAAKGTMLLLLPSAQIKKFYKSLYCERFFALYMGGTLLLGLALLWGSFG
jgi:hypothetical protein